MTNFITAGVLAKLAGTTKRTIHFYDEKGVLKPVKINTSKYRLYQEQQVLDYQMILLLSTLGVSLNEMRRYLKKKNQLSDLFHDKKPLIKDEIDRLRFNLTNIDHYLINLEKNGTLVNPEIKNRDPFDVYYIDKIGPYAKISTYCRELGDMFLKKGKNFTTLSIFEDQGYRPKQSRMKICTFTHTDMVIKDEYKTRVKRMTYTPGKVITYTYRGEGNMLSLFWKELEKYCKVKGYSIRTDVPDYEVYWRVDANPVKQKFEICLPIR